MTETIRCSTCRWGWGFKDDEGNVIEEYGYCRRYAPKPSHSPITQITHWPAVAAVAGCGEWVSCII